MKVSQVPRGSKGSTIETVETGDSPEIYSAEPHTIVIISNGTINFLIAFISASLVSIALSNMSLPLKSSEIITISMSLSSVSLPSACEPNRMIFETFNPPSVRHCSKNLTTSATALLAIPATPYHKWPA